MRSAQIITFNAADNSAGSHWDRRPWSSSQRNGTCRQATPATSAPLWRQRSCHVAPGWLSSQSSSLVSPRIRLLSVPAFARTNGGLVTCVQISCLLRQVAGQFRASARAGKRARADSRMLFCLGGHVAGVVTAATVTILPSRTERSGSPVGSQGRERV